MTSIDPGTAMRDELVNLALRWQEKFGVAPAITSVVSEYDAACLIGHDDVSFGADCVGRTSVTAGYDFMFNGVRYQVKANRPSGKPGSYVTLVAKAKNFNWDKLLWLLYDREYVLLEAWEWGVEEYRERFESQPRVRPKDMREGVQRCPERVAVDPGD